MNYRKTLIRAITFLGGVYFFLEFVLPARIAGVQFDKYTDQITKGFVAVGAMAVGLGVLNLLMVHGSRLLLKRRDWVFSAALLLGMFLMVLVTALDWRATNRIAGTVGRVFILRDFARVIVEDEQSGKAGVPPRAVRTRALADAVRVLLGDVRSSAAAIQAAAAPGISERGRLYGTQVEKAAAAVEESLQSLTGGEPEAAWYAALGGRLSALASSWRDLLELSYSDSGTKHIYVIFYDGLYVPLGAAMFSLLGFYIATAAYRAFRVQSAESALMMAAALVVMLGQIPFGVWLWHEFPEIRTWMLRIPSAAASRAIQFGASIAALVMAFRMWFSIESETFGDKKE